MGRGTCHVRWQGTWYDSFVIYVVYYKVLINKIIIIIIIIIMTDIQTTTNSNVTNPAVKRILRELKEIQECDNPDIIASALEDNIFEWLFIIRGAPGTDFEGGLYHGRIIMPAEYPFKPPAFVMSTPSGRFETKTKICLSISSYHPESWQPSWSVQSALVALIAFMQTPGQGAIGSLDCSPETRRQMALESQSFIPQVQNNPEKQALINGMHATMLARSGDTPLVVQEEEQQQDVVVEDEQQQLHTTTTTTGSSSSIYIRRIILIAAAVAALVLAWMFLAKKHHHTLWYRGKKNNHATTHGMNLVEYSIEL